MTPRATTARFSALIAALAIAWLCALPPAAAQVGPAPPQPPVSADAKKADAAKSEAEKKTDPVREAMEKLRSWSLADLITWVRIHGPSVVVIVLMVFVILWLAGRLDKRLIALLARRGGRDSPIEQENRARTLVGVAHNALRTIVIAVAAIMILELVGVPVGPLMGGVAVAGLAVAFGAQSLIKDFFTGFLILFEQQYMIGDIVKIGAITGEVEQITLRVTVVRDQEGAVHFIPHGQINLVSNLTHDWSQAVFDLQVPREESVERVRDLFFSLVGELRSDSALGKAILNDPEMLGVDSLGDTTITIKFALKTVPLKRWQVKRELLRRIKERFQEEKIKVIVPA